MDTGCKGTSMKEGVAVTVAVYPRAVVFIPIKNERDINVQK